jgi:hypothetical protein
MSRPYESYLIAAKQAVDWATGAKNAQIHPIIYEFRSCSLRPATDPIKSPRFTGSPSPVRQEQNFLRAGGDIEMDLHADNMLIWLQQLMMSADLDITSTDFTTRTVRTNGVYSSPVTLTTQPTATTPASSPGKLIFTFDPALGHSGGTAKTMTITGTDQNDLALTEVMSVANGATVVTSTKYFKSVTGIVLQDGFDVVGNLLIEADKNTYTHQLVLGDDILDGLTLEIVNSGIPETYIGCLINEGKISIADIITFSASIIAKYGWQPAKIHSTTEGDPESTETPTDVAALTRASEEILLGWASALYLDGAGAGSEQSLASMSFSLNNNLNPLTRFKNSRYMTKPVRGGHRVPNFTFAIDYDSSNNDWDVDAMNNEVVDGDYWAYKKPYGGAEYSLHISLPRCQFGFPSKSISDFSQQIQEISLEPIRTVGATSSDEIEITYVSTEAGF